jgi:hypothetical protein
VVVPDFLPTGEGFRDCINFLQSLTTSPFLDSVVTRRVPMLKHIGDRIGYSDNQLSPELSAL